MSSDIRPSSGNVFADLGLPDADQLLLEADEQIDRRIAREKAARTDSKATQGVTRDKVMGRNTLSTVSGRIGRTRASATQGLWRKRPDRGQAKKK